MTPKQKSPRAPAGAVAGSYEGRPLNILDTWPTCKLHGLRVVNNAPDGCPASHLNTRDAADALYRQRALGFRLLDPQNTEYDPGRGAELERRYCVCMSCIGDDPAYYRVRRLVKAREMNREDAEARAATSRILSLPPSRPPIPLPVPDAMKPSAHRNGKAVVEVASNLKRRRRKPTHAG